MTYEPRVWTVSRLAGTMVTTQKGHKKVTQNMLWFRKATFKEPLDGPKMDDAHWEAGCDGPEYPAERGDGQFTGSSMFDTQVPPQSVSQDGTIPAQSQ
ncbi:hypothetical protein NDU88_005801 [Pleurodeles waltl]|uniref:Uncharacterized protein n=1 Tax=Pleurodeles waltl TaxID=8319 RepID=A0AAV7NSK2_PLEWA|nr:hypothetical protein NDU88_005801 [Pleurodeles waltl]